MSGDWTSAAPTVVVAVIALIAPGLAVRLAGWNPRSLGVYFAVPAISLSVLAIASNGASIIGIPWSWAPVIGLTVIAAIVAFLLRRWVGREDILRPGAGHVAVAVASVVLAFVVIVIQLTYVFAGPEEISQTFDNIIHLNAVADALSAADSSALQIGSTSDIGFYPNAWHSITTLIAQTTGASVPVAVNSANIAIGALLWPASCMALGCAFFATRRTAVVASAALSTAFGAFPILLLSFGVLYPNTTGYAALPAGLAAVWWLLQAHGAPSRVRQAVLLLVVCGGIGLGHPNAFLALFAFSTFMVVSEYLRRAIVRRAGADWRRFAIIAAVLLTVGAVLWKFARTNAEMSQWGPWTDTWQALLEGAAASPRSFPLTVPVTVAILLGLVTAIARPRNLPFAAPYAVALFMFVLVSGTPYSFIRDAVTNPWYNDSYRLAALLPITAIPVATLGIITIGHIARRVSARLRLPRLARYSVAALAGVALFSLGAGPNVTSTAAWARQSYLTTDSSALLTSDERTLLDRLTDTTPEDAVIVVNPWTGGSLAHALAGRSVTEKHIFSARSREETTVDEHLSDIDTNPAVCDALVTLGATYVLDFGSQNVFNNPDAGQDRRGLNDLPESPHLILVDSEGSNARLYRIEGCE